MIRPAALICAALLGAAAHAQAPFAASPQPRPAWAEASSGLVLRGAGTLRWFGLKVYDAELWTRGAAPDFAQPFALNLRYARSLKGSAIAERSVEEIAGLAIGTPDQRRAWGRAMTKLFPDVQDGSSLTGLHVPGWGARFFRDGQPLGEIADPEFSRAFFSIWLDPRTSAPELRAALRAGQ